jgi:hypothetical protein
MRFSRLLLLSATAGTIFAGQTHTWSVGEYADFQKGLIKNLSLRSDGVLGLAPRWKEYYDSSAMYLWTLARDSKGNLYTGGGTSAKLYRIGTDGKGKVLADLDALEIHAIAVDSKDRVYAATTPDGKVFRVAANGKAEVFYDPKAKYIWAMAFDRQDNLFVATGDRGEIHKVAPDGKGSVFFQCDETHVRSLTIDGAGNLIVGTSPGGLVMRVSPAGEGFVLYQTPKQEVTAVAAGGDGSVYAAGVGTRQAMAVAPPAPAPAPPPQAAAAAQNQQRPGAATNLSTAPVVITGGSDLYRIEKSGEPRRIWTHAQDLIYAMAFDGAGRLIIGTGNRGNIYRIESPTTYTALLSVPATQITAFQMGDNGRLFAAAGNVGKLYEIDATLEQTGSIESEVFDAGMFTQWGRLSFDSHLNGGQIAFQTRSGNLDQPQKNWSSWSSLAQDGRITSPAARFVQWKATLTGSGNSPELESIDVAYLSKNVEPRVDRIEATPPNYRFPATASLTIAPTLNLPALGRQSPKTETPSALAETPATNTPAMQYGKGYIGVRWMAGDPNGDALVYTVEIRGTNETQWKPLKDKVSDKYYSWDSTAFPDGEYRVRVTASDSPSNPPAEALTARQESDPFLIDNTPPKITALNASHNGSKLDIRWHAADALNDLSKAEYSLDGGDWTVVAPTSGLSDAQELDYALSLTAPAGEHTVAVRVEDAYGNVGTEKAVVKN